MKKILSLIALLLAVSVGYSQAPGIFNYQGVARNSVGNVLKDQSISLRLTIRDGVIAGPVVYQESRTVITNPFGLFNVQVGGSGATNVTGTIAGVNWGVGLKFIQVEIDPAGGTNFINLGTAQLASVPYSLYSTLAGDLVLPFNKTQSSTGSLFKVTNSGTAAGSTALEGVTNSTAGNAFAVIGTVSSASPGGFSAGVRGINNGTGGLGIGVWGSQEGSGWGVYGTALSGIGVNGVSQLGIAVSGSSSAGVGGRFTSGSSQALWTTGLVRLQGISEANNRILSSDASGNATWKDASAVGIVTGTGTLNFISKWTPSGTNLGNSLLFDDGTSVALGTTTPTHRFTVSHGGSTGIGVSSTTGFSVVDINAANGDAALRFGSAGVNQWNVRNRPTDNSLEFFELGGGGSRMIIQDGTGNLGVGETVNPTYRLDVLHGGSTGIRSRSSASFSVVDIDAFSGDAALRFQKNGSGMWNTRNRPADDYYEWFELGGGGSRMVIQRGTGNVGIGETTSPSYRLDVLHGGSTGARIRSSASFSVVDIDAASGDAALRFAKAGVNQWNIRNRPADDYLEIFELGGGGSRMVIQDGTGNVGIGETTSPSYKLDVLHGGSTGIRSRSSGSFSVVDIDAASGDAALRFARAGVNQWNIRNRPADDYLEIFELGGGGSRVVIQDGTGNVGIGETTSPSYKLDVLHGGSTGIRSRSSGSFSVVDIDGASGDAALRFANNGVNQWNIRNRPADDYLEIFELGGGGSRMVIQDGTGNVGIGETTSPSYKLDVLHGGSTGIRSRSSGSFSVVDIDAASGDAALRFAKAGVNQWNTRNRPADDYYEIFELGGGGSRFVIQDGTGNVGIGETTNPTYRLDVLHGGATGIRSRSTATFSLMDIDAANGDAALRFAKAGVNQWNIRNNPGTDDLQIFELGGGGERMRIENTTGRVVVDGDLHVAGTLSKAAGAFKIDHPLDPANKYLVHSFVESPDMMNIYNGNVVTDASGKAIVSLPDYFEALNMEYRYQLTVIGSFAQAIISKEVAGNKFEIATNQPNVKVSWQVTGIRHDAWANKFRIPNEVEKDAKDKGQYLNPEAYDLPKSRAIGYTPEPAVSSLNDMKPADKKAAPPTAGGSLDQAPIVPPSSKQIDRSGSVADVPAAKPADKVLDKSGSVEDVPAAKPTTKVLDQNGSVQDVPAAKPATKVVDQSGSVQDVPAAKPAPAKAADRTGSVEDKPATKN